jgi:6-phosphogluconolactonase
MANVEFLSFPGPDALAAAAAGAWLDEIESAGRAGKNLCVALSGGRITQKFFAETVAQAKARGTAFDCVHFFWADERCVPPGDPESNFKLADERLFKPLNIAAEKIHRLRGEDSPQSAVQAAEAELNKVAPKNSEQFPVFDIIFLGMGEDGHIASLFPNASAKLMDTRVSFLVVEDSPKPPPTRISLSYKAILAAKNIWVLVSGAGKAAALRDSLSTNSTTPLGHVIARRHAKIFSDVNKI